MTKKKILVFAVSIILTLTAFVGATIAYIAALAGPVENSFTIGDVEISLTETTGVDYSMIPGKEITKDPCVTVKQGSETCWLYVKVDKTTGFDDYLSFEMEEGWTMLPGHANVYYRSVLKSSSNQDFGVLKGDVVTVSATLTEEKMSGITVTPKLGFKAYAIQAEGVETALRGWQEITGEDARE